MEFSGALCHAPTSWRWWLLAAAVGACCFARVRRMLPHRKVGAVVGRVVGRDGGAAGRGARREWVGRGGAAGSTSSSDDEARPLLADP